MIRFHFEDIPVKRILEKQSVRQWLTACVRTKKHLPGPINYIFVSDPFLLEMNKKYLNHHYHTDVITFDYSEKGVVSGDIYISYDRLKDNAKEYGVPLVDELHRVMAHGLLHLMGYNDQTEEEQREMRSQEDICLDLRSF